MTHEDLISHLAQQLGWSNDTVSASLDALIAVLKSELDDNKTVTIDDFGRFLVRNYPEYILRDGETNERYLMPPSLEVEFEGEVSLTGEDTLPPPLCFTPDDALNDFVNSAFSPFEPVLINEGADFPGLQEVVDQEVDDEDVNPQHTIAEVMDTNLQEVEDEDVAPQQAVDEVMDTNMQEVEEEDVIPQHAMAAEMEAPPQIQEPEPVEMMKDRSDLPPLRKKKKGKKSSSVWIPIAGGMAVALAVLFFFKGGEPVNSEVSVQSPSIPITEKVSMESPVAEEPVDVVLPQTQINAPSQEATKVRLTQGKTLRVLALELFGSREFWVYIYLENKTQISNPNQVPIGLELIVPDQAKYGIDANDPSSVLKAKEMSENILGAS